MRLDKETRTAIAAEIREALDAALRVSDDYVSGKELGRKYQMFSASWLKSYGHLLPRTRAVVTGKDGRQHTSGWCYPVGRIGRMIESGEIKRLGSELFGELNLNDYEKNYRRFEERKLHTV